MNSLWTELLEPRRLLAVVYPTIYEQYMVELFNRARADPAGESVRHNIDLNEHLDPGTITTDPKQPLAINPYLDDAAHAQARWLVENTTLSTFSHAGPGGNSPTDRMSAAGYTLVAGDHNEENAAINLYGGTGDLAARVAYHEKLYFQDTKNVDGTRGHRLHMMDPTLKEVGTGIATGPYDHQGTNYEAFCSVLDFATHTKAPFLTGVAYTDAVVQDNLYTPGEGLGGVNVAAVRVSDGKSFSTRTWPAGGYSLQLQPGTYNVYAVGGALGGTVTLGNVTLGADNVKKDFTPQQVGPPPFTLLAGGTLFVNGSPGPDAIGINRFGNLYTVTRTGASPRTATQFDAGAVKAIQVDLGAGDDSFVAGTTVQSMYVIGGLGNDIIQSGDGNDTLTGAAGKDRIYGRGGDDRVNGGSSNDLLFGDDGGDRIYGGDGQDALNGIAGIDWLYGEGGNDSLAGGSSNDKLFGGDGNDSLHGDKQNDNLDGGAGNDSLWGDDGNDNLIGGTGNDLLSGGIGDDFFNTLDGLIDNLNGGAGLNTGKTDPIDVKSGVKS